MRQIALFIIACLFSLSLQSVAWMPLTVIGGSVSSCLGCIFHETFNGATEDNVWTDDIGSGTWLDDYTTSPAPLEGAQSLQVNDRKRVAPVTSTSTLYYAAKFHVESTNASNFAFYLQSGGTIIGDVEIDWGGATFTLRLFYNAGGANTGGSTTFTAGQTRYVKVFYQAGSGADGVWTVWLSSDGASWNQEISVTDATDTVAVTETALRAQTSTILFDDIRIDDVDINY